MAFRNIKGLSLQIKTVTQDKVREAIRKGVDQDYMDTVKDRIVKRTQLGVGVDPETGTGVKLPPLSDNYKEQRQGKARWFTTKDGRRVKVKKNKNNKDYVKKPRLASTTKPSKSNLTATGQLLKALTVIKVKSSEGVAWLITVGDRRGLGLHGTKPTAGNKAIVDYLKGMGRHFLDLTKSQRNEITREIRHIISRYLK